MVLRRCAIKIVICSFFDETSLMVLVISSSVDEAMLLQWTNVASLHRKLLRLLLQSKYPGLYQHVKVMYCMMLFEVHPVFLHQWQMDLQKVNFLLYFPQTTVYPCLLYT